MKKKEKKFKKTNKTLSLDNPLCFTHNVLERISYRPKNVTFQVKENMIVIRDLKTFYFDFDWPKDDDENLKHEIECIITSNDSLA